METHNEGAILSESLPSSIFSPRIAFASPEVFAPGAPSRLLLYEYPYVLDRRQWAAIAELSRSSGCQEVDVTVVADGPRDHFTFAFEEWERYERKLFGLESVLFQRGSEWGIFVTAFGYVAAAGPTGFADRLRGALRHNGGLPQGLSSALPETAQVLSFLAEADIAVPGGLLGWPLALLEHLYGGVQAQHFVDLYRTKQFRR